MGLTTLLSGPYYTGTPGSTTSAKVPDQLDVAIGGRAYMVDTDMDWGHITLPLLRQQSDQSIQPSESAISPEELWRRSMESWHRGAGQQIRDLPNSDPHRFRSSKGVDPWTRWQLSLLPDTDSKRTSVNTGLQLQPAGTRLYLLDSTSILFTTDVTVDAPTWTAVTGASTTAANGIASNGFHVWTAHGSDGLYETNTGSGATAKGVTGTISGMLDYVKDRIIASEGNSLYNITDVNTTTPAALPTALLDHPNSDWTWVGAAAGSNNIYIAGYSGDKAQVYRTQVKADGTALDVPVVAGELPDGEVIRAISGYLGYILLGTDRGVRFCAANADGDLTVGDLVGPEQSVRCFEGQGRFVWFGWDNYDGTDTGLGRLDLREFLESSTGESLLAPVYASDLMVTAQGNVVSVVTFQDIRVFAVDADGVWAQDTTLVAEGSLDSGEITYGMTADSKIAMYVDLRHEPLAGTVGVSLSADGATFTSLGVSSVADSTRPTAMTADNTKAETFELRLTLDRSSTDTTDGPDVVRVTLRAFPAPARGVEHLVPVLLHEEVTSRNGTPLHLDPEGELSYLEGLATNGTLVAYQYGDRTETVRVESVQWQPYAPTGMDSPKFWNGTAVLRMRRYSQGE